MANLQSILKSYNRTLSPENQDSHCQNCTCEHILPINPMVEEHRKVITAMWKLYDVWDEDLNFNYPKYLPSFDDFIHDFRWLLGYDADKERGGAEVE